MPRIVAEPCNVVGETILVWWSTTTRPHWEIETERTREFRKKVSFQGKLSSLMVVVIPFFPFLCLDFDLDAKLIQNDQQPHVLYITLFMLLDCKNNILPIPYLFFLYPSRPHS